MIRRVERRLGSLSRRKRLVILLAGAVPLALRALLLPILPAPQPRVQDEFSHLLVADTFAHGRLVNPVHPMWRHFESMHIVVKPVYASVFPVAHGIAMAAGKVVVGSPWAGVWIGVAAMCAALSWMLYGWLPPGWALLGTAMVVARFGVLSYWMNSYYGGALAAAGGALVLGAWGRGTWGRRGGVSRAALMALGLAILANSRAYEGSLFAAPFVVAFAWKLRNRSRRFHTVLPLILIAGATAAAMAYYCARVTGNPWQLPYAFYRSTFTMAPHFVFQSPRPEPIYLNRALHEFHAVKEMGAYQDARANRPPHGLLDKAISYWRFFLGPVLTIPLFTLPWLWRRRRLRLLLLLAGAFAAGLAVEVWHAPHYAAPAAGLVMLLVIEGLRQLRAMAGPWPVRLLAAAGLLTPVIGGGNASNDGSARARVLQQLDAAGGRHLVLVRYQYMHDPGDEWVYNAADIDASPVVWAREMDPTSNRELVSYSQGRRVWLLQPDLSPPSLMPWDPSNAPDRPFRFVKLGTPEITVLRSPEDVRRRILSDSSQTARSCDLWNYAFTQATGVEAPDPALGCFPPNQRGAGRSFEEWFAWLMKQR